MRIFILYSNILSQHYIKNNNMNFKLHGRAESCMIKNTFMNKMCDITVLKKMKQQVS